jgi:hypothetical protein
MSKIPLAAKLNNNKSPDIETEIEMRSLEPLGSVMLGYARIPEMALNNEQGGRREVGRPELRWVS